MKMLALEFSSPRRSVAVAEVGEGLRRVLAETSDAEDRQKGALRMIELALGVAQVRREEIEVIAVGLGPGSYTGIRMAIAVAQGWQLARRVRIVGASSTEAVARRAWAEGCRGRIVVAVDAQRGDYYLAKYEVTDTGALEREALHIVPIAELEAIIAAGDVLVMPEERPSAPGARAVFPTAADIAMAAAEPVLQGEGGRLEPVCLRSASFMKAPAAKALPQ